MDTTLKPQLMMSLLTDQTTPPVIETHGLTKTYKGAQALKIVSPAGAAELDLRFPGAKWGWQNYHH
jgi:hypothetical protein